MAVGPQHTLADPIPTISLDLPVAGRAVTVVGATVRATAAADALVAAGAVVTVVCPNPPARLHGLAERGLLSLRRRTFADSDLDGAALILAHTGDADADAAIASAARRRDVFCVVDRPRPPAAGAGRVILVGGGPGDPGLLTIAGRDAIACADVVVTDRLAPVAVLAELAPHALIVDAAKFPGGRRMEQHDINAHLIRHARAGRTVVRLKGGDGFVFGRGGEEIDECVRAGITVDVIPGVSSAIAAPASAGIPVTHRGLTQGFTVVSGHVPPGHPDSAVNYAALARANTTIVLMMAVANLDAITRALMAGGLSATTPAAVIADGSLTSQRDVRGTLGTIATAARRANVGPPATTVIGAVAGFIPGHAAPQRTAELHVG